MHSVKTEHCPVNGQCRLLPITSRRHGDGLVQNVISYSHHDKIEIVWFDDLRLP